MPDTPSFPVECALCSWTLPALTGNAPVVRRDVQAAVVAHHIEVHGTPSLYGREVLTYDPSRLYAVAVPKDLHGLLVIAGDTVRTLTDDDPAGLLDGLTTVESAVLAARLRAWSERLSERDLIPRPAP